MRQKNGENAEISAIQAQIVEVLKGFGYSLVELTVSKQKGSVQVRAVIYNGKSIGTEDCTKVHRAVMPRLELLFPEQDIYLEVSSPGVNRVIKNKAEFAVFTGERVRCYRTDISDWTAGILESAGDEGIELKTNEGIIKLNWLVIAKAKLDSIGG